MISIILAFVNLLGAYMNFQGAIDGDGWGRFFFIFGLFAAPTLFVFGLMEIKG